VEVIDSYEGGFSEAAKWHAAARAEWPVIAFASPQDAFECRGRADTVRRLSLPEIASDD
jgi:hypothetical protein